MWLFPTHGFLYVGLLLLTTACQATLYNLQDGVRPRLNSQDKTLDWWDGGPALALASTSAVRLNFRALITYPPKARIRDLARMTGAWHGIPCNVSAWALCSSSAGQVMPGRAPEMPGRAPEGGSVMQVDGWNDLSCTQSTGKLLVSKGVYDISACDILDAGLDVVYTLGTVFHRHSSLPLWKYWTLVVLSIALVRFLSHNIQTIWDKLGHKQEVKDQVPALLCSFTLLVIVLVDGDSMYITTADQLFFWATAGYIVVYLVVHAWRYNYYRVQMQDALNTENQEEDRDRGEGRNMNYERPVYNIIVATLQLVAMRFYTAAETPYNMVLLGMLAARGWYAPKSSFFFGGNGPLDTLPDNPKSSEL